MTQIYDLVAIPRSRCSSAISVCRASSRAPRARRRPTLHGPISTGPKGNRVYFGYGTTRERRAADRRSRKAAERAEGADATRTCSTRRSRGSTCRPIWARTPCFRCCGMPIAEFAKTRIRQGARFHLSSPTRSIQNECHESRQMVWIFDVTDESKPFGVSTWTVPEDERQLLQRAADASARIRRTRTCTPIYYKRVMFFAHFNAGVRARGHPRSRISPKEIGYYIPAVTDKTDKRCVRRRAPRSSCKSRDPDQQRGSRRPRLHLHRRPRQYRHAHPRAHRRGAQDRELAKKNCPMCGRYTEGRHRPEKAEKALGELIKRHGPTCRRAITFRPAPHLRSFAFLPRTAPS